MQSKREEAGAAGWESCRWPGGTPTKDLLEEEALVSSIEVFGVEDLGPPSSQTLLPLPALPSLLAGWFVFLFLLSAVVTSNGALWNLLDFPRRGPSESALHAEVLLQMFAIEDILPLKSMPKTTNKQTTQKPNLNGCDF